MLNDYLFTVPAKFEAAINAGEITRVGALLKNASDGKIVAHLQETMMFQNQLASLASGVLSPVSAVSSLVSSVQLEQVKSMLESLQLLNFVTLGASFAGIGVSTIGFSIMTKKLNSLRSQLDDIRHEMRESFNEIRESRIRDMLAHLQGTVSTAEHKYSLRETGPGWISIGMRLIEHSERFRSELEFMLSKKELNGELFDAMLRALLLANNSASRAFLLSDKLTSAIPHLNSVSEQYNRLFDEVSPTSLCRQLNSAVSEQTDVNSNKLIAAQKVQFLRDIQETAATAPLLIDTLIERKVSGPEYLSALQAESSQPLVFLKK